MVRDRDPDGRVRQARPRDRLGRPLPYGSVGVEPVPDEELSAQESVSLARRLLREGRPFSAHEVLENRWKCGPPDERDLWQGLAQVCVAVTHAQRGNRVGAERLLARGCERLRAFASRVTAGEAASGLPDPTAVLAWAADPGRALAPDGPAPPL